MAETTTEPALEERVFEFDERQIPVSKLKLDELNYRHNEVDNQIAAIRAVIEHQGEKLIRLAAHILENGITPGERIQVVADDQSGDEDAFVVTEGNRRITVFKLLDNPDLASGTVLHEPFKKMAREFARRPVRKLPCVILQDREQADVWMDVKHSTNMGGAGIEKWDAVGMSNREASKGRTRRWWATLKFLEGHGEDVADIREGLKKKTTAADRVLGTGIMKDELGVAFSKDGAISFANGDMAAGARLLKAMMAAMSAPTFNTNDVHAFGAREAWIRQFAAMAVAKSGDEPSPAPSEKPKPAGEYPVRDDVQKSNTPRADGRRPDQAGGGIAGRNPEAPSGRRAKSAKPRKALAEESGQEPLHQGSAPQPDLR